HRPRRLSDAPWRDLASSGARSRAPHDLGISRPPRSLPATRSLASVTAGAPLANVPARGRPAAGPKGDSAGGGGRPRGRTPHFPDHYLGQRLRQGRKPDVPAQALAVGLGRIRRNLPLDLSSGDRVALRLGVARRRSV